MVQRRLFVVFVLVSLIAAAVPGATQAGPGAVPEASQSLSHSPDTVAVPSGTPADWWGQVQEDIRQSEYDITWQDTTYLPDLPAAYQSPNRAQGIRIYFTPQGIRVIPRAEARPSWRLGLALVGHGDGQGVRVSANRLDYWRESAQARVSEWYVNDERGLETGFTIRTSQLQFSPSLPVIELALTGDLVPRLDAAGTGIEFATPDGTDVLRYGDLQVTDRTGRALPVQIHLADCAPVVTPSSAHGPCRAQFSIIASAMSPGPLTLSARLSSSQTDGLPTIPDWFAESNQVDGYYGYRVSTAGDVNGDGYCEAIVGAYLYDNGEMDEGAAFLYYGSADGLSSTPSWMAETNQVSAALGRAVGTAGDVNGDGYDDVILGTRNFDNGEEDEGAVFVWYGSASGLGPDGTPANADWMAESNQGGASFGHAAGTAGDVNGDGYSDIIAGAMHHDNGQTDEGAAFVWYGSASGLGPAGTPGNADWTAESNQADAYFGQSVGTAGDVNGDGYADVIVGAHFYDNGEMDEGRVYVYHGSASGLSPAPGWTAESNQASSSFGIPVSTAGDVNGDGYSDIIVGASGYDNGQLDEGAAFIWYGSPSGLGPGGTPGNADWMAESNQADAWFGNAVATAGDVNGDGYADVLIGAYMYINTASDEGAAFAWFGSAAGLGANGTPDNADWAVQNEQSDAWFGFSVGPAGDVNGDGYADIIVGALAYDNGQSQEGRAYAYYGSPIGLAADPGWTAEGNQADARLGKSAGTAGDVNGDGYADVIVGAPLYDNGQTDEGMAFVYYGSAAGLSPVPNWTAEGNLASAYFGDAAGTAGDVNGDGYADVIVGAPGAAQVYIHYGSPSGLSPTAGWTATSDQGSTGFGSAVGAAGDVNGDGYADVIVGAPTYDNGETDEGRVYVFHGSRFGPSPSSDWSAESNQTGAKFGYAVGSAGDVNRDGYSDIIVGAPLYDNGETNEGRAYVYHGSSAGLNPTPNWTAEGNQTGEPTWGNFGTAVGTAGDVNGDGYADGIVGAPFQDNGHTDEGIALVYYGSPAGLNLTANWTAEGDQAGAHFGEAVGTAGDVNGDGYADVVIGALFFSDGLTNGGRAFVYQGSTGGLGGSPNWTADGGQDLARFGWAVGTSGDVNGDGYADVIVSAQTYDNGQIDEGAAFLCYGNAGVGLSLAPQQRRSDNSAPVAPLGMSDADAFRVALRGRTPFGRGQVKLEWEVKPLGTPFNGSGTQQSSSWIDTGTAGVQINELVDNLSILSPYHWRVRLLYRTSTTPYQPYSRWLTMPWNGWNEQDLRTGDEPVAGLIAVNDSPTALGQPTHLTATIAAGSNVVYAWALGDGTTGAGPVLVHTYPTTGTYTALVTASNAISSLTATTTVVVGEALANLAAINNSPTALGQPTHLTATITAGSNVSYTWAFGDGATGNGASLSHTYLTTGTYTALVTASNAISSLTATTTVIVEETIAGLTAVNDSPTPLGSVTHLTATVAAGSNVLYSWALGDGTTGTGPVLAHTYLAAGTYPALVTATNAVSTLTATTSVQVVASGQHYVYLPIVFKAYFLNPCEPNDDHTQACGPLASGQTYPNYPDDTEDWFYVEMGTAGNLQAVVTNYSATGNLLLYAEGNYNDPIAAWGQGGSTMTVTKSVAAGTYYVRVYTASGFNTDQLYDLVSTYP